MVHIEWPCLKHCANFHSFATQLFAVKEASLGFKSYATLLLSWNDPLKRVKNFNDP